MLLSFEVVLFEVLSQAFEQWYSSRTKTLRSKNKSVRKFMDLLMDQDKTGGGGKKKQNSMICLKKSLGSLVVRASDSRPKGLGSMPDATKYPPSTHGVRAR
ncbi:hypothetical protein TNCV_2462791 [Trichonephila clavipes]|nr:hypothetical protein TNCV_2462791 [Trichonephila clavipes]